MIKIVVDSDLDSNIMPPLISIALASYNGAKYIEQQIDSILNQTIKDIEIVVSDDVSTDNTLEILKGYQGKGYVRLLDNRQKLGVIKNFENALRHCIGQYVAFSDQDDVWLPKKMEKSLALIRSLENMYGSETPILIYTDAIVVDESLNTISESYLGFKRLNPSNVELRHLVVENVPTGCTMLMNRPLANLVSTIPAEVTMHDVFVSLTAACFGKMAYLDEPTLLYRQHQNNVLGLADKSVLDSFISTMKVLFDKKTKAVFLLKETLQAKAFLEHFRNKPTVKDYQLLEGFVALKTKNKISKTLFLLKGRIVKGYWLRTLNLLVKI
jgi:glycosyltransferase involved in cell wall biosynthesis